MECSKFLKTIPLNILKEEESKLCDGEIGLQEISSALNTMVNNKSPGND